MRAFKPGEHADRATRILEDGDTATVEIVFSGHADERRGRSSSRRSTSSTSRATSSAGWSPGTTRAPCTPRPPGPPRRGRPWLSRRWRTLAARLERLELVEEARAVTYAYAKAVDAHDEAGLRAILADDVVLSARSQGGPRPRRLPDDVPGLLGVRRRAQQALPRERDRGGGRPAAGEPALELRHQLPGRPRRARRLGRVLGRRGAPRRPRRAGRQAHRGARLHGLPRRLGRRRRQRRLGHGRTSA